MVSCVSPEDPLAVRAATLQATVTTLAESVGTLTKSLDGLESRTSRGERGLRLTIVGLCVDVLLSVVVLGLGGFLYASNSDVKNTQAQLEAQHQQDTVLRHDALCPLYSLLIGFYNPASRDKFPQGPAAYDRGFTVLRNGAAALNCPQSP
jgi:hypothetical protein